MQEKRLIKRRSRTMIKTYIMLPRSFIIFCSFSYNCGSSLSDLETCCACCSGARGAPIHAGGTSPRVHVDDGSSTQPNANFYLGYIQCNREQIESILHDASPVETHFAGLWRRKTGSHMTSRRRQPPSLTELSIEKVASIIDRYDVCHRASCSVFRLLVGLLLSVRLQFISYA
jgi:hypothetical protein